MYLSNIKLWNFRKFGLKDTYDIDLNKPNLDLNLNSGMNVLIGENDSGKSAIIDAIRIVLKTQDYEWYRVTDEDFFQDSKRFRIELRFDDLANEEAKNFIEWISYEDVEDSGYKRLFLRLIYDVERNSSRILPSDVCAGNDQKGYPLTSEAKEYLKVTYLKPLRDAEGELTPGKYSRLSSILFSSEVFDKGTKTTELEVKLQEFDTYVESFFADNSKEGYAIKGIIDEYIKKFITNASESKISFSSTEIKHILAKLEIQMNETVNPGLGTLNRLYMAAELLNLKRGNWNGVKLGLIEELEAHLHPQAQMKVIEKLFQTSEKEKIQLILTTHSPNLASKVNIKNLIMCVNGNCFPMSEEYTNLEKNDYVFLQEFLDATKSNLFFAKGLIFVEGWAEQLFLTSFSEFLKERGVISQTITEAGVSVINVGGVAFLRYSKIFQRKDGLKFNIPIAIITDSDVNTYEKKDDSIKKLSDGEISTKRLIKLESARRKYNYDDYIKVFLALDWTFEYALYSSKTFNVVFEKIVKEIHSRSNWTDFESELANKLLHQSLSKTEIAYKLAMELKNNPKLLELTSNDLENDKPIAYLVEALKFVCK